tara:strand:+ start:1193 stop:2164 length:972 start_codon:yes stop_codon:yes gene_type:complete
MNIGFIGCGDIAHFHADVLKALGVNILSVSGGKNSSNIGPFSKKYDIGKQYTEWKEMISNEKLDALWVVVNWDQMDNILIPLIETGISLFLEKPVALSSGKIQEAINLNTKLNQYIQVGYNRRFYSFMDKVKTIINDGELRSILVEIPEPIDFSNIKLSENLWIINSSHIIDLLLYFVGPLDVKYKNHKTLSGNNIKTSFNAVLHTELGIPVHIIAEWNTANNFSITFFVDNKRIVLKPLETATVYEGFNVIEPTEKDPVRQYRPTIIHNYLSDGKFKPGFYEQAEYFINNTISDKPLAKHACLKTCLIISKTIESILSNDIL